MGKIIEGLWDCPFCGNKRIRAGQKTCPDCGHPQDENTKFYMPDEIKYVSEEEAEKISRNPDWQCSFCGSLNSDDLNVCKNCGATKEDSERNYFEMRQHEEEKKRKKEEKKDENSGTVICPVCQNANKKGFRFCTVCGNKLDEAESTKSSDPVTPQPAAAPAQSKAAGQQPAAPAQDVQRNMGKNASQVAPAFEPAKKTAAAPIRKDPPIQSKPVRKKMAFNFAEPEVEEYKEPVSVFAQGLPSWDVVPPQIMVRRKKKK